VWEAATNEAEAINKLRSDHSAAYNAGDTAALVGFFTDDAVLMPPNNLVVVGKEAIESRYQLTFTHFTAEHNHLSDEIKVMGDYAFERGTYEVKMIPKAGGESVQDKGKYIAILQRQPNDTWKFARLIWNSDNPPR
jgi:uncharacterized protein (TIGR02246 family)